MKLSYSFLSACWVVVCVDLAELARFVHIERLGQEHVGPHEAHHACLRGSV